MSTITIAMCTAKVRDAFEDMFRGTPTETRVLAACEQLADAEEHEKLHADVVDMLAWLKDGSGVENPRVTTYGQAFEMDFNSPDAEDILASYCQILAQSAKMHIEKMGKTRVGVLLEGWSDSLLYVIANIRIQAQE